MCHLETLLARKSGRRWSRGRRRFPDSAFSGIHGMGGKDSRLDQPSRARPSASNASQPRRLPIQRRAHRPHQLRSQFRTTSGPANRSCPICCTQRTRRYRSSGRCTNRGTPNRLPIRETHTGSHQIPLLHPQSPSRCRNPQQSPVPPAESLGRHP